MRRAAKLANDPPCPILGIALGRARTEDDVTQDGNERQEKTAPRAGERPEGRREARAGERVPLTRGLSMKLLVLTALFVTLAEMLIFLPSLANFRLSWLEERLSTAAAVGIVIVVSFGRFNRLGRLSSTPMTLTSSGTRRRRWRSRSVCLLPAC